MADWKEVRLGGTIFGRAQSCSEVYKKSFSDRIACWDDTRRLAQSTPAPPPTVKLRLDASEADPAIGGWCTSVAVEDDDSIDCALLYARAGCNPVVLNMADDRFPGGGVAEGSGAQEESLFRRTNLCAALDVASHYPVRDDELLYSPGVTVFKASEGDGWATLPSPQPRLAFISCPAVRNPDGAPRLPPVDEDRLRLKIRHVLRVARDRGHDVAVLGAMGCGAWRCPARHVAAIFHDVLRAASPAPEHVVFAVLRGTEEGYIVRNRLHGDNHEAFREEFRDWSA